MDWKLRKQFLGDYTSIPGGGYITPLGRTAINHRKVMQYLVKTDWFTNQTRFLFVDFVGYNPSANLFNIVCLMMQASMSGDVSKFYTVSNVCIWHVSLEHIMYLYSYWLQFRRRLMRFDGMCIRRICSNTALLRIAIVLRSGFDVYSLNRWKFNTHFFTLSQLRLLFLIATFHCFLPLHYSTRHVFLIHYTYYLFRVLLQNVAGMWQSTDRHNIPAAIPLLF